MTFCGDFTLELVSNSVAEGKGHYCPISAPFSIRVCCLRFNRWHDGKRNSERSSENVQNWAQNSSVEVREPLFFENVPFAMFIRQCRHEESKECDAFILGLSIYLVDRRGRFIPPGRSRLVMPPRKKAHLVSIDILVVLFGSDSSTGVCSFHAGIYANLTKGFHQKSHS